jgi:hypothetical protein
MFFFFSWGNKWQYKVKGDGLKVGKCCPECDKQGIFFEVIPTKYFSIFGIPVTPTETKKPLLECPNCHEKFYIQQSDYLLAIKDLAQTKGNSEKVISLANEQGGSRDICIVPCDECGQKLKVPKNDKMLRITCPLCKYTFNFQKGEKVQKAAPIDPHSILKCSRNIWWKKHACWLIPAVFFLGIVIFLFTFPEHKPRVVSPSVVPFPPPVASPQLTSELNKLKSVPTEKPIEKSSFSPIVPVEPRDPKRLPNGALPLGPGIRGGHSTLTVDNGTEKDALVTVLRLLEANKKQQVRNFYIQEGRKWTTEEIPPGRYVLIVAFGKDWNLKHRRFNFQRTFSKTEPFEISEMTWQTEDGQPIRTRYSKMSITLHKVFHGNFKSHEISEEEFMRILANSGP